MKLSQLFEIDPEVGRMLGRAASGIGQAASNLKGPLTVSDVQGRVEQEIDKLEKAIVRDPKAAFDNIFRVRLNAIKKEVGLPKEVLGLDLDVSQLTRNGKPNSVYIRKFLADFIKTLDKKIDSMNKNKTVSSVDRGPNAPKVSI